VALATLSSPAISHGLINHGAQLLIVPNPGVVVFQGQVVNKATARIVNRGRLIGEPNSMHQQQTTIPNTA